MIYEVRLTGGRFAGGRWMGRGRGERLGESICHCKLRRGVWRVMVGRKDIV